MMTRRPTVIPRLVAGRENWILIVDHCPHCGKRHTHGGGPITGDPAHYGGHRVADCFARGGYELIVVNAEGDKR